MDRLLLYIAAGVGVTALLDRFLNGYISKKVHKHNTGETL